MTWHPGLEGPRPARQLRARFFANDVGQVHEKARPLTPRQRRAIFERDGYQCQYCGCPVEWLKPYYWPLRGNSPGHVDHVVPRARGGSNDPSNLKLACEECNESKGARDV